MLHFACSKGNTGLAMHMINAGANLDGLTAVCSMITLAVLFVLCFSLCIFILQFGGTSNVG